MTYSEAATICDGALLPKALELFGLEGYAARRLPAHTGGRNLMYRCEKQDADTRMLRVAYLGDRSREDLLAEVEYIRYLANHGGSVANVLDSRNGNLVEEIAHGGQRFFVSLFELAKGKGLADNNYRYRDGAPLSEYFFNCGKVLGRLHRLSKEYVPSHRRYDFFDKFNPSNIYRLLPAAQGPLKEKLYELIIKLGAVKKDRETYGMVHFDYSDGNYTIDYDTGGITVFDFDNCCFCWYLYDLATLWVHGVGWVQFEPDKAKRKAFMDEYFATVLAGYRTETGIRDETLELLPLFIDATVMEGIADTYEVARNNREEPELDGELRYSIKCLMDGIPYNGFFHEIYSIDEPFQLNERNIT